MLIEHFRIFGLNRWADFFLAARYELRLWTRNGMRKITQKWECHGLLRLVVDNVLVFELTVGLAQQLQANAVQLVERLFDFIDLVSTKFLNASRRQLKAQ